MMPHQVAQSETPSFFDTDALSARLTAWAELLGDGPWTDRFPFRPTFELVARHLYGQLEPEVPGLAFVELEDRTTEAARATCPSPGDRGVSGETKSPIHRRGA